MSKEAKETYRTLWEQLNALIDADQGESEEAEAIRDQMDNPWRAMTQEERNEVKRSMFPIRKEG
jgi:hypothetical protein